MDGPERSWIMETKSPEYSHIEGKTYTLFGSSDSTSEYYKTIRDLAERVSDIQPDLTALIEKLQRFSNRKRGLKRALEKQNERSLPAEILNLIDPYLSKYTYSAEDHLMKLPISKIWDHIVGATREQYHLYMLEVELLNRLHIREFMIAERKVALLPHCLQDLNVDCRSVKLGFDYQCRHCSPGCFQNHACSILKNRHIEPFIWQSGSMKQLVKETTKQQKRLGVLGIACLPELINGMRVCRKNNIPVVGLPLNANRCARWFGKFLPNSVDLPELMRLVEE
jgi:hypothetical protein